MAVHSKPRPIQAPTTRRTQSAQHHVPRETAQRGILQSARDVFLGKPTKVRHPADAQYAASDSKPSLKSIIKEGTPKGLIPHGPAIAYLDQLLSKPRKT